jgi:hypothetical protein
VHGVPSLPAVLHGRIEYPAVASECQRPRDLPAFTRWFVARRGRAALTAVDAGRILELMIETRRAPVLLGLLLASLLGVAVPSAGAVVKAAALSIDSTLVTANWKEGWLRPHAAVRFTGDADAASALSAVLRPVARPGVVTARLDFRMAGAGAFSKTMPLPPRTLPGRYRLRIFSTSPPPRPRPAEAVIKVPAPPEGVIDRALVGTTRSGPWLQYVGDTGPAVSGQHTSLWVRFRFLYPPQGRRVELVWKLRWHTVIGKVYRRYANTIDTYASSGAPLPKGVWLVVLKIDGRIAKRMNVRLR